MEQMAISKSIPRIGDIWKTILTITFAWMFDAMDLTMLSIVIKSIAIDFNISLSSIGGLLLSAALLTSGLGGIFFGYMADKIGRKKTLSISILTYGIPTLFVGFVSNWQGLLLLRLISGFGVGGAWAAGMTLISETVHPEDRGTAIGIVQSGFPIGFMLAVFLSYMIAFSPNGVHPFMNWRLAFIAAAIPAIIMAVYVQLKIPESNIWKNQIANDQKNIKDLIKDAKNIKYLAIAILLDTIAMMGYWMYWSWLPSYLSTTYQTKILSATQNLSWLLLTQMGAVLGYISYGRIQDKLGRRPTWVIFTISEGILIITSIFILNIIITQEIVNSAFLSIFYAVGFALGFGTGYWSAFGAILSELFPTKIRSTFSGLAFNIGRSINFVSPILVGIVAQIYGWAYAIGLSAIAVFITSVIIWMLPETRGKHLE
ncbi:MAG: MFS transporter [Candidatus Njordarchaeum guaymaensis]